MEHPSISRTLRTGYPTKQGREVEMYDYMDNAVYKFDDVIAMPEGIYRVDDLSDEEIEDLLNRDGIIQEIK